MGSGQSRMDNERRTIEAMVALYCHAHHGRKEGLCDACRDIVTYARRRLAHCPYQQDKPTCSRCPIHCYKPEPRATIREVMRYAGPRMFLHHPFLAIRHLRDRLRKTPQAPRKTPPAGQK
jgi:predicted amidophosphoribosyltransferase